MERFTGMGSEAQWFKNESDGVIGAVKLDPETGRPDGVAVGPGATIELSEDEQRRTASAPSLETENPLVHGGPNGGPALVPVTIGYERPLRPAAPEETAGEQPDETAAAPEGSRDVREEVGVPPA
jgi:hypothetical protein